MKKFMFFMILCLLFAAVPATYVSAETINWVRVVKDGTYFYRNATTFDSDALFELQKSYYLKVVGDQNAFYEVELMDNDNGFVKIYGYVLKTEVVVCDYTPELPLYPAVTVTVTGSNAILYRDCSAASQALCSAFYGQQLYYYGMKTSSNSKWYFVKTGETFAYINSTYSSVPLINLHPTPLPGTEKPPETTEPSETTDPPTEEKEPFDMQIALIVLICIPAVIIVIVLFLPAKQKAGRSSVTEYKNETVAAEAPIQKEKKARPRYFDDYL